MDSEKREPGRFERLLESGETKRAELKPAPSYMARSYAIIRRRIITGALFLIPIITTYWFLNWFLGTINSYVEPGVRPYLEHWSEALFNITINPENVSYKAVGLLMSVTIVLLLLYLLGLMTSRTAIRRLIVFGESLVVRIPFVKFFYKTSKQIVDTLALPATGALKKIVLIEFTYPPMKAVAFATGETPVKGSPEPFVNVFIPTTPHLTAGYMVLLPPNMVWETDLTMEDALKFIISGGILHPASLAYRPYRLELPADAALHAGQGGSAESRA